MKYFYKFYFWNLKRYVKPHIAKIDCTQHKYLCYHWLSVIFGEHLWRNHKYSKKAIEKTTDLRFGRYVQFRTNAERYDFISEMLKRL